MKHIRTVFTCEKMPNLLLYEKEVENEKKMNNIPTVPYEKKLNLILANTGKKTPINLLLHLIDHNVKPHC